MVQSFPKDMVSLLRCNNDAGEVSIASEVRGDDNGVLDGILRCRDCGTEFPIEDGIARFLPDRLRPEDSHEMNIRNAIDYDCTNPGPFIPPPDGWRSVLSDQLEVPPHMRELQCSSSNTVLELACGDGRITTLIAETGARILAVDFSINALRLLDYRLPSGVRIGRLHADINQLHVASRAFDRALSLTPLHSRDERMHMFRMISNSLMDDGRYVGSVEHDDLNRRLLGLPLARRYSKGGILIEHLTLKEMRLEAAPYFSELRIRPIRPRLPLVAKLPRRLAFGILQLISVLPIGRQFGELLLLTAQRPVRVPVEGEYRSGSRLAKGVYRSYMRKKDQAPSWGEESV
jgi:SAM-dependent methyltransferase